MKRSDYGLVEYVLSVDVGESPLIGGSFMILRDYSNFSLWDNLGAILLVLLTKTFDNYYEINIFEFLGLLRSLKTSSSKIFSQLRKSIYF